MTKEFRSRFTALHPRYGYLPASDRFLTAPEKPRYQVNIIGLGIMGMEHLRLTMIEGRANVHGVYDPNPGSIAAAQQAYSQFNPQRKLVVYDSLEAASRDPAVDALMICTPNFSHIDLVRAVKNCGKHILLEKPMATTLADAREIADVARDYPKVFQIGLQYRYKSIYQTAIHEALERKSLGSLKMINIVEHRIPFLDKVKQWNKFSIYSGGTLVEKCCHYFDLFNLFAGSRPATVYASGSMAVNFTEFEYAGKRSDILDNAFVTVLFENGVRAGFNLCMFAPMFYEELTLCGDEGRLKVSEMHDFVGSDGAKTHFELHRGENRPIITGEPHYAAALENSGHNGATFFTHINFIDNIEGRPTDTATAEEGFWSVVIGTAAEESVKTGKVVEVGEFMKRELKK